jgi:hypothetical protein
VAGYRGRLDNIVARAVQRGINPTPLYISRASGVPLRTITRLFAGESVSTRTMTAVVAALHSTTDKLFEPAPPDEPLRPVRFRDR